MPELSRVKQIVDGISVKQSIQGKYEVKYQELGTVPPAEDIAWAKEKYGLKDDVHDMCISCQFRQIAKYEGFRGDAKHPEDGFYVKCDFVPRKAPPEVAGVIKAMVEAGVPREEAVRAALSEYDAVAWAELHFGFRDYRDGLDEDGNHNSMAEWRLRPHQKEEMRCTAKRMTLRQGRRTGKTFIMCLKILHSVFTKKVVSGIDHTTGQMTYTAPKVLVATPMEAQLSETIFPQIEALLRASKDLVAEVQSGSAATGTLYKRSPAYTFKFRNGGIITGVIAGTNTKSDGSGGGAARGMSGSVIVVDEMDMVAESVLHASIRPITMSYPDTSLWVSSTPIGKPGLFKEYCTSNKSWKEFYFPSTVLSNWKSEEAELVNDTPTTEFKAEWLAKFIDDNYGVFKRSWIANARKDYSYANTDDSQWWRNIAGVKKEDCMVVMGIDWNKTAGSEYVVIAFDMRGRRWWVIDASNIPYEKFSSQAYKNEVIRLQIKHDCDWIYADKGYGHHLIEDLQYMAHAVRTRGATTTREKALAKLVDILVPYDFASNVELASPIDGSPIKKKSKQYLVQNAQNVMELGSIYFPYEDQRLYDQLIHYIVKKESQSGLPVYGSDSKKIGDHRLDAFMLSLVGIHQKKSVYSEEKANKFVPSEMYTRDEMKQRYNMRSGNIEPDEMGKSVVHRIMQRNGIIKDKASAVDSHVYSREAKSGQIDRTLQEMDGRISALKRRAYKDITGYDNDSYMNKPSGSRRGPAASGGFASRGSRRGRGGRGRKF